jgi:Zn-dependent peptidase ImmA (M78 family)/DNA-binding XRE family transcriptional regulator
MKEIFAYRLKNARLMKGFSLQYLANEIGVSKPMIAKYEKAQSLPDSTHLIRLSEILGVKPDYFFQAEAISLNHINFRKKSKYPEKQIKSLKAKILHQMENYLLIEDVLAIRSEFSNPLAGFEIANGLDIEKASSELRQLWNLGNDPIYNVITLLESNEIKVIEIEEPDQELFDGVSAMIDNKYPIIAINKNFTVERKRFTLLHELGHLVLNLVHFDENKRESLCHRFAGAMLLPEYPIIKEIGTFRENLSLNELFNIQKLYGISVSAIIYRLADLNVISDTKKKRHFVERNTNKGYKESVDRVRFSGDESSERFSSLVYRALSQEIISISKASALLNSSVENVRNSLSII